MRTKEYENVNPFCIRSDDKVELKGQGVNHRPVGFDAVDLHLSKALFSLDTDNPQLHCVLGLGALFCCSFFCPLDRPYKTLQTV